MVKLWDVPTGRLTTSLEGHAWEVFSVGFSPDGKTLASGGYDKAVRLWDVAAGRLRFTLKGHTGDVNCVAFHPNGKYLASGSRDKTIKLWDLTRAGDGR